MNHVLRHGELVRDGDDVLQESLNVSISIEEVGIDDVISKFADAGRIQLMMTKYESREIIPPYNMSYGCLFFDTDAVNQVEWAISRLRKNPNSKSATIGFHRPGAHDLSCISLLDFKLRQRELVATAVYRSQNVLGSQPGNALALRKVQEQVCTALGAEIGPLVLHIVSAHIYSGDVDEASRIVREASGAALI